MITSLRAAITEYPLIRPLSEPVRAPQSGSMHAVAGDDEERSIGACKLLLNFSVPSPLLLCLPATMCFG